MAGRTLGVSDSRPLLDSPHYSLDDKIVATPSGTQANAAATNSNLGVHVVTTVGTGNDSVALPQLASGSGRTHWVYNNTASNSMQVFGLGTDTIDAVATGTGVAIAAQRGRMFYDYAVGKWLSFYGA